MAVVGDATRHRLGLLQQAALVLAAVVEVGAAPAPVDAQLGHAGHLGAAAARVGVDGVGAVLGEEGGVPAVARAAPFAGTLGVDCHPVGHAGRCQGGEEGREVFETHCGYVRERGVGFDVFLVCFEECLPTSVC